ncbi:hypothetical protein N9887_04035, partial [Flavobacteriaceae bacterium]|nr:hypothetical protein [Flavobacteriaceae bacterium]
MGIYQSFGENSLSQLLAAKEEIEKLDGVISVNEVNSNTTTYSSTNNPSSTYSSIKVTVRIDDKEEASNLDSKYFQEIYEIINNEVPESQEVDGVTVTLYYGYNIGIAHKTHKVTKTIEE